MNKFFALVRKDWRLYRYTLTIYAFVMAGTYALASLGLGSQETPFWRTSIVSSAHTTIILGFLFAAGMGGAAFTTERVDGSAEFLSLIPVTRRQIMLSKLAVASSLFCVMIGSNVAVIWWVKANSFQDPNFVGQIAASGGMQVLAFGLAWLLSSFSKRASDAAIAAAILSWLIEGLVVNFLSPNYGMEAPGMSVAFVFLLLGSLAIGGGFFYYARRVAP